MFFKKRFKKANFISPIAVAGDINRGDLPWQAIPAIFLHDNGTYLPLIYKKTF